jgi:sulfonate transport system substrate-binding protein
VQMGNLNRRVVVGLLLLLVAMRLPCRGAVNPKEFRIGYQKAANTLVLLKAHGTLEQRLRPLGIEVTWSEFTAGPQLLEGLNVGSIDFGYVGEVPPISRWPRVRISSIRHTNFRLRKPKAFWSAKSRQFMQLAT